jgi:hypothetical protein
VSGSLDHLAAPGLAVSRVTAAAGLARAVADHAPNESGDFGKLDCLDAIELHPLRPASADPAGGIRVGAQCHRRRRGMSTNERHASDNVIVEERLARIKALALAMECVAARAATCLQTLPTPAVGSG